MKMSADTTAKIMVSSNVRSKSKVLGKRAFLTQIVTTDDIVRLNRIKNEIIPIAIMGFGV